VDALLTGTGGADGWPQQGCHCSSCMSARSAGIRREPGRVVIDATLECRAGQPVMAAAGSHSAVPHSVEQIAGGWDVTGPDGSRLLLAAGPGQVPQPPPGAAPYHLALLDLLVSPAQLGLLRAAGLVHARTAVAALYTDHRASAPAELARRCEQWQVCQGHDGQLITGPLRQQPGGGPVRPHRTLIVGGARSGKSTEAELRLSGEPRVTYLAAGPWQSWTGPDGRPDTEWADRVATHRARRPTWWRTAESLDLGGWLRRETGALLIDGIGTWLAGIMDEAGMWEEHAQSSAGPDPAEEVQSRIDDMIGAWRQTAALVVAVTDEVGSGLVPPYPAGRVFRDELGWLNQRLAAESELTLHVVAGRPVPLSGCGQ
jgi:adenosylcobinamide kinase / adenosylcobinamide-phosphate guanylyltransferase